MNRYVFAFTWKSAPDASLAAAEHTQAVKLIADKHMEQMFLAEDRSRGWLVMLADTPEQAAEAVATLPFAPIMQLEVTPVMATYP